VIARFGINMTGKDGKPRPPLLNARTDGETLGSRAISPLLHQNVQENAMLVDRAPQIMQNTADADEHLVQVPRISRAQPAPVQPSGEVAAEFRAPEPNALVAHDDAAFGKNQLDVTQAEAEHVIQPNCLADDLRRKAMAGKGGGLWCHAVSLA
jgi:hypothetical protein